MSNLEEVFINPNSNHVKSGVRSGINNIELNQKKLEAPKKSLFSKEDNRVYIGLKEKPFSFGLFRRLVAYSMMLLLVFCSELMYFFSNHEKVTILKNYVLLYTNIVDYWDMQAELVQGLDSYMLWGNNMKLRGKDPATVLKSVVWHIKNEIIANFDYLKGQNLGNYTAFYKYWMDGNASFCQREKALYPTIYQNCSVGQTAMFDMGILASLKLSTGFLESMIERTRENINDRNARLALFRDTSYKEYRAFTSIHLDVYTEAYFILMIPLTNHMDKIVNEGNMISSDQNYQLTFYAKVYGSVLFVASILLVLIFIVPVIQTSWIWGDMLGIFPLTLLSTNKTLFKAI